MKNISESVGCAGPSCREIDAHAAHNGPVHSGCRTDLAETIKRTTRGRTNAVSMHRQTPRMQSDWNDGFLAVISHELRNSLGAIQGAACILSMPITAGPAAVKARALIERQIAQMRLLVEDLLDVSQAQSGRLRLRRELIDLGIVAAHAAQSVEFTMQQQQHRMTTSFPDAPLWLQGDSGRLEQVVVNLLLNAAKYTDAGGEIELRVERDKGEAVICIRDTGIGMTADVLPHVFELFVQADPSSQRGQAGLGIGLSLVRSLVEGHGGSVTAASAGPGRGSTFTVRLPATAE